MKVLGIIPARFASTRLAGKPLKDICGKPMIRHVYERARRAASLDDLIVATDDQRIVDAVRAFGGMARLTSPHHRTGTDRIFEVARGMEAELVINIQGDEPLLDPRMIDELAAPMLADQSIPAGTLCAPILDEGKLSNPNVVKVVVDRAGFALYFSRSLIPFPRRKGVCPTFEHIGIYAYRKDFLTSYVAMEQSPLEIAESLEQLRILEMGHRMLVITTRYEYRALSVDTQDDLDEVSRIVSAESARTGGTG